MKRDPLNFKIHTQILFQVPGIGAISRDQNDLFSKFDLKKRVFCAEVAAFHASSGIFFFFTVYIRNLVERHKIREKIRTSQYDVKMTSSKVVF